ncbi:PTS lactose/cellobiose transporter subunit IIA [Spiroplasma endosymbiont of Labia minor]|uniref:PTS lactose/cellobiose transporter subunit IIA n=1 Tax=Spiroplasma endosymbiont of Labia minor TaxID=3066305 RepID=UPI0030D529F5
MDLNSVAFQIISSSGDGFSDAMQALELIREQDFENAQKLLNNSEQKIIEAHKVQSDLLFHFANGEDIISNVLLGHAQDHLAKSEVILIMANEIMTMKKELIKIMETK